jgi:hypothetical protein
MKCSRQLKKEASMAEQQNLEIAREGYAAFGRGDIEGVLRLLDDNVEWQAVIGAAPHVPTAGKRHGKQAVAEFFRVLGESVEFARFEPREFIAQGDTVVILGFYAGRAKSTGRTFAEEWAMVETLKDGKIVRLREYVSTAAINAAFEPAGV